MKTSNINLFSARHQKIPDYGKFIITSVALLCMLPGCTSRQMSVEEAKQVTVAMSQETFSAPPRRIDDILEILEKPGQYDPKVIAKMKIKADAPVPAKANATFFLHRSDAAISLGRAKQAVQDLKIALRYAEKEKSTDIRILNRLARLESINGNFSQAIELAKQSLQAKQNINAYDFFVGLYTLTGDFKSARTYLDQGLKLCKQYRFKEGWGTWPDVWAANMQATFLDGQGRHSEAEPYMRAVLQKISSRQDHANLPIVQRSLLAENLVKQDRLLEAELEARQTLNSALGLSGKVSGLTIRALLALGEVLISQGRLNEAQKLCRILVSLVEESGISADSLKMGLARMLLGKVSTCMYDFNEAAKQFDILKRDLRNNQYLYQKLFARNPDLILSLIKTGCIEEATGLISAAYELYRSNLDENHYLTAELLGLRGMVHVNSKNLKQALADFRASIPALLSANTSAEGDFSSRQRLKIIIETYLNLLAQVHESKLEDEFNIQAASEAFRLADILRGHVVQRALGASGARTAIENPQLADLVRKEQDASHQIRALQSILSDALAAPQNQRNSDATKELTAKLENLTQARSALLAEIKRRFPKYSDFTNPQAPTPDSVKKRLIHGEALISIYSTENQSYVWMLPHAGEMAFFSAELGRKQLRLIVADLRTALTPDAQTLGDIPAFDLEQAYHLYRTFLQPLEPALKDTTDVIIVTHGPLGQLPFALLPTLPSRLQEEDVLFASYRRIPWLIRKVSITRQPAVASFVTLRNLPKGNPERRAFAGFGDPVFDRPQTGQVKKQKSTEKLAQTPLDTALHIRGIRVTDTGNLDSETISSSRLEMLHPLPDTADEIKSIAKALDADPDKDIFLGERASEHIVKTTVLSDRRTITFATHALIPGDLDGLDQPALALCSPKVTGENEDGLLTMGEILKLKLNADWVVLSACNTGAAEGAGAEAISGLGRAFFYAGSRAILVSMWPVETTSARQLTTRLFEYQKKDDSLSRSRALQKSILSLMDSPGMRDTVTGKVAASYAHPIFWAPFIIVGDNGHRRFF
jgi:CHAT domain-containing protein